jgi:tight adherence protein B
MSGFQLTLLAFTSGALVAGAGGLFFRGLFVQKRKPAPGTRLRRINDVFDEKPGQDLSSKIDQGFNRLVLESGTEIVPLTAFLLCMTFSLALGGIVFLNTAEPFLGLASGVMGLLLPLGFLVMRRNRRINLIRDELPNVLDMMARATRAGRSIDQAIELVGQEAKGILGAEFERCSQQLQMGRALDRVMKSLSARVCLVDIRILSTTLIVQKQAGGKLSETLERMGTVVRERLNSYRQIRASTGAGRASTLIVAAISPLAYAFVFLFHREHLQIMFDDSLGNMLLIAALALEVLGLIWVAYLLKSER